MRYVLPLRCFCRVAALALIAAAGMLGPAAAGPQVVNGRNFLGLDSNYLDERETAADVALAVGPTRFIQMVNDRFAIYTRANTSTTPISAGALKELTNLPATRSYNPQVIWDPTTNRFYFSTLTIHGTNGTTSLSWGWSKTASPNSAADFCFQSFDFEGGIPDSPTLGDNQHFVIFGLNLLDSQTLAFKDAALAAWGKPPAGTGCEAPSHFTSVTIRDTTGNKVFAPAAANSIDSWAWGYAIARNFALPSNKLWLFPISRHSSGNPVIGPPKELSLSFDYRTPPDVWQGQYGPFLDTGDAELTQAVIARNPSRANGFSLWTQHTVFGTYGSSDIQWYEIDPFPRPPTLRRSGRIATPETWLYNAAISPDRRVDGGISAFGDSFVIQYNRSNSRYNVTNQIGVGSSVRDGPLAFGTIVNGGTSFQDETCNTVHDEVCAWGDYSGVAPDPRPVSTTGGTGVVWGANVFPKLNGYSTSQRWLTQIFAVKP